MRRLTLWTIAGVLAFVGVGAVAAHWLSQPRTLTIAVGPAQSDEHRLIAQLAAILARENADMRLKPITVDSPLEAAQALQRRAVDLAIVRSDISTPPDGLAMAVMRRDVMVLFTRPGEHRGEIGALAGKKVAFVRAIRANHRLLERVVAYHAGADASIEPVSLGVPEAAMALKEGRVDAVMVVGPLGGRWLGEAWIAIATALGAQPGLQAVPEADAIAGLGGALHSAEIPRGALGGAPVRPEQAIPTIGVTYRMVAHRLVPEDTVAQLTQLLFTLRPALAAEAPLAARIEAPDGDRGSQVAVHPGATAYFEGDIKTFLDRYGEWVYIAIMAAGFAGSLIAGVAGLVAGRASSRPREGEAALDGEIDKVLGLLLDLRHANDENAIERVEAELDAHVVRAVGLVAHGGGASRAAAFQLAFEQVRARVTERRALLAARAAAMGLRAAGGG